MRRARPEKVSPIFSFVSVRTYQRYGDQMRNRLLGERAGVPGTPVWPRAGCNSPPTCDLWLSRPRRGRRLDQLRPQAGRELSPGRDLRRQDSQGRKAQRAADRAADENRAGHQSQDRQSARARRAADAAQPRRRGDRVRRKEFIRWLVAIAAAWPLTVRAQPSRKRLLAVLMSYPENDAEVRARLAATRDEMRKLGWSEGENLRVEERWAGDNLVRIEADAAELIRPNAPRSTLLWGPWCCRLPAVGGAMGRLSPSRAAVSPFETVRFHAPPRRLGVLPVSRSRR